MTSVMAINHRTFSIVRSVTIVLAAAATLLLPLAQATPVVSGVAQLDGTATVTNSTIQFFDNTGTANTLSGEATGNTLSYATLNGIADPAAEIQELTGGPFSGSLPPPGFVDYTTFNVTNAPSPYSEIDFDLETVNPGVGTPGACFSDNIGNECTPLINTSVAGDPWVTSCPSGDVCVLSPFTRVQFCSNTVDFLLSFSGLAYYAPPPGAGPFSSYTDANFDTQGVLGNVPGIVEADNALHSGSFSVSASVAGSFGSTPIPEPTSVLLAFSGLLLVAGVYRRSKKYRN